MGTGGWKTPWPIRFGGNAHEPVETNYYAIRADTGDALSDEEDSATDAETQAQARLLAGVDAVLQAFIAQSDPRTLTTLLPRWEAILGIQPSVKDSGHVRRQRVAGRLLSTFTATNEGIARIASESFSPWKTKGHYLTADDAVMYWPGGDSHPSFSWYSTIANVVIEYYMPAWESGDAADSRIAACKKALDEFAPAWATFSFTRTPVTGDTAEQMGFYLDRPNLDVSVLW